MEGRKLGLREDYNSGKRSRDMGLVGEGDLVIEWGREAGTQRERNECLGVIKQ